MILYHGTCKQNLKNIIKHGGLKADHVVPRAYVYLARTFGGAQTWTTGCKVPLIFKFSIPKKMIVRDDMGYDVVSKFVSLDYLKALYTWDNRKRIWVNIWK